MPADGMDFKGAKVSSDDGSIDRAKYASEIDWPRPKDQAPSEAAPLADRERWSLRFVPWYFSQTGGEAELPDVPAGHRWRSEYFRCVANPEAFEKDAEQQIEAYRLRESGDVEGN